MYVPVSSEPMPSSIELGYKLPVGSATRGRNAKASNAIGIADETISIHKTNTYKYHDN